MSDAGLPELSADAEAIEFGAIRKKLEHDFAKSLPLPLIDLVMQEEQDRLVDVPVEHFVPLLVERAARERLRGLSGAPRRNS